MIAVAIRTLEIATEKTAAISLFDVSEVANMVVFLQFVFQQDRLAGMNYALQRVCQF
jgi:hypothetical protein